MSGRLLVLFLSLASLCAGQTATTPLVNLARLGIARIYGDRDGSNDYGNNLYGVRNAFDGGRHFEDGVDYSTWLGARLVIVRFSVPVTVHGLVFTSGRIGPENFSVQLRAASAQSPLLSPLIPETAPRTIYALSKPEAGVREVMISFVGGGGEVREIEILGPKPAGVNLTEVTPAMDTELIGRLKSGYSQTNPAHIALVRTLGESAVRDMSGIRLRLRRASDDHAKAQAWYDLNEAADRLAGLLRSEEKLKPVAEQASSLGVKLYFCDPSGSWGAEARGYEEYLNLWLDGPQAELAWRMSRLDEGPRCGDGEGSLEEYDYWIDRYTAFLKRFNVSSIGGLITQRLIDAKQARQQLLDAEKKQPIDQK